MRFFPICAVLLAGAAAFAWGAESKEAASGTAAEHSAPGSQEPAQDSEEVDAAPSQEGEAPPTLVQLATHRAVEGILSFVLETKVTVESMALDPDSSLITLKNVTIQNPKEFGEGPALRIGNVKVDPQSEFLRSDDRTLHLVELAETEVFVEQRLGRGINLTKLQESADRFKRSRPRLLPGSGDGAGGPPLRIERAVLEGAIVHMNAPLLFGKKRSYDLGKIEMDAEDFNGQGTVKPAQLVSKALERLWQAIEEENRSDDSGSQPFEGGLLDLLQNL